MYDLTVLVNPYHVAGNGEEADRYPELNAFLSVVVSVTVLFLIAATSLILGFWYFPFYLSIVYWLDSLKL